MYVVMITKVGLTDAICSLVGYEVIFPPIMTLLKMVVTLGVLSVCIGGGRGG